MEDVIFAGTRDRKPLGLASVTLTLVDPKVECATLAVNGSRRRGERHGKRATPMVRRQEREHERKRKKSPSPAGCSVPAKANT